MRVAHVHRLRGIGGSERHLLTLLPALGGRGVDPLVIGLDDPAWDPEPFYAELRRTGVEHMRLHCPRDLDPLLPLSLARALRRLRPDVVHTHLVHADVYGAVATTAPIVSTKHNDDPFRVGPFRFVERALARRAARIVAISEALKRFTIEHVGVPAGKVDVVPYGLDELPPPWADAEDPNIPNGARLLLAVARLVPQKGLDIAVHALAELRRRQSDVVLAVLGEGPERGPLSSLARNLGIHDALFLPGRVGDVRPWYRRASALVHPARWEGFGLTLLEAMLAGLPVAATRVSSIPEIVADGKTGILVPPDDPPALVEAVERVLERADELGAAGRDRARLEFSVDRMAGRTIEVYERARRRGQK